MKVMSALKPAHVLWRMQGDIAVNLTGVWNTVRACIGPMRERGAGGSIILTSSTAGLKGLSAPGALGNEAYGAAKHGVVGLMRALAIEMAPTGVTVNAVCPGFTETTMLAESIDRIADATKRSRADVRTALAARNPQGRFIKPQEVAEVVLWLCGSASASITGQAISVSGGETW